jgi:hypothetical protein
VLAVSDYDGECEQAMETTVDLENCLERGAAAQLHDRRSCWVLDLPAGWAPGELVWIKRVCPLPVPIVPSSSLEWLSWKM